MTLPVQVPVQKQVAVSRNYQLLPDKALTEFARKVIFAMHFNPNFAQSKSNINVLVRSVTEMEDRLNQRGMDNNLHNFHSLKTQRMEVLNHLHNLSKTVKEIAKNNPEQASTIIKEAGFECMPGL